MKSSKFFPERKLWYKFSFALLTTIPLIMVFSCQKVEFENEMVPTASFMKTALKPSVNAIIYHSAETFSIVSKNGPFVATRTLANPDFKYFEKFILKVKNGNGISNKVRLEILIDDVVIITTADFTKRKNVILKELPGLTPESVLEIRLDGTKNKSVTVLIECSLKEDVIADIDGNYYHTVKIGDHWYMSENLRVTKFNDGTAIPLVEESEAWENLWIINTNPYEVYEFPNSGWAAPAYCWYNNDLSNKSTYGALYSASVAVGTLHLKDRDINYGNVCPVGWHVGMPVEIFVREGGTWNDAGIYKEAGTEHWVSPNTGATNSTGFTALPGGFRGYGQDGVFGYWYMGYRGTWWTGNSENDHGEHGGTFIYMNYDETNALDQASYMEGMSIRCMKDF